MFDIPFSSLRINIDLKVANEGMKSELAEKTQLLRQAHNAMERFEQERLREKADFESQIVSLKQTLYESQQTGTSKSGDATGKSFAPCGNILQDTTAAESNNIPIGERTHNLLTDAFGSINLVKTRRAILMLHCFIIFFVTFLFYQDRIILLVSYQTR